MRLPPPRRCGSSWRSGPTDAVRDGIRAWQQAWQWPRGARLVPPERLHLTLHFIGNVPPARLPALTRGLRIEFEAIDMVYGDGAVWPGGIAVLRPARTPDTLARLHARLAVALGALELPVESRAFRAHVTLARRASGAVPPPGSPALAWRAAGGYVLVRSLGGGAGYRIIERFSPS